MRSLKPCPCAYWTVTPRSDLFLALLGRRNKKRNFPSPRDECKRERHSVTLAARVARPWRHGPCYFRCECDDQLRRPGFLPWSRHAPRDHPSIPGASGRGGKEKECAARFDTFRRGKSTRMPLPPCGTLAARAVRHTRRRIFWPGGVEANPPPPPAATSPRTKPRRVPGHRLPHRKQASRRVTGGHDHGPARRCPTVSGERIPAAAPPPWKLLLLPPRWRQRQERRSATTVSRPARAYWYTLLTSQTACSQSYRWSRGGVPGRNLVAG